jgi:hypothetical protein
MLFIVIFDVNTQYAIFLYNFIYIKAHHYSMQNLSSKIPVDMNSIFMKLYDQRDLKVTYIRNLNFQSDFCSF